ncbi:hypothetical protein AAVH_01063 [Aphelenchoides avenae]|nr:hypothetical protein AAVH_01063 [Aphelenchus avenae]
MGDIVSKTQDQSDADKVRMVDASTQTPQCVISNLEMEPYANLESVVEHVGTESEDGRHAPPHAEVTAQSEVPAAESESNLQPVVMDDYGVEIEDGPHTPLPADITAQSDFPTAEPESNLEPVVMNDYGVEIEDGHHTVPPEDVTATADAIQLPIHHAPQRRFKPNPWCVAYGDDGEEAERMAPQDFEFLIDYEPRIDEYHIMILGRPKKDKKKNKRQYWKPKEPAITASAQSVAYDAENDPFFAGDPVPVKRDPPNNTAPFNGTSAAMAQNTPELDTFEAWNAEMTQSMQTKGVQSAQKLTASNDMWPGDKPRDALEDSWPEEDESEEENFRPAPLNTQIEMCQWRAGEEYSVVVADMFGPKGDYLVHLSEYAGLYYELHQALWPFYDHDKRTKYALTEAGRLREGVFCVVVDSPTYEEPCRAFVQRYDHAKGTADVILVDKGETEVVPIKSLVQLDERFAITPVSAVRVVDPLLKEELPPQTRCVMHVIALKEHKLEVELRPRQP